MHKSNMSGEANSTFSTITPKKTILGKLLTYKMFTAEKNKESAFVPFDLPFQEQAHMI